jgi:hypothetical protein
MTMLTLKVPGTTTTQAHAAYLVAFYLIMQLLQLLLHQPHHNIVRL